MTPPPTVQPPGAHHRRFGDLVVTSLNDGFVRLPPADWVNCDAAEGARLSALSFGPAQPCSAINAILVRSAGTTVLIDAGCGTLMGPTAGTLPASLAAIGVQPSDVDMVLLTHMHADHLGGAVDAGGDAVFPRAELVYPAADGAFWLDPARLAAAADADKRRFALPQRVAAAYAGRVRALEDGGLPNGIAPLAMPGHSPGHTGYVVGTGSERMLTWGDVVHVPALQMRRPEVGVRYDLDPAQAEATRRKALDMAAADRVLVHGAHMDFPGFAHIERVATGGYAPVWSAWAPEL